jgi:hypothetical protein
VLRKPGRTELLAVLAAVALLAVLVPVGRWERSRQVDRQASGIRALRPLAGPDLRGEPSVSRLSAGRTAESFNCLIYAVGGTRLAVELCFDQRGRLVEAIDRRGPTTKFWLLRNDPARTPVQIPIRLLLARFHEVKLFKDVPLDSSTLPVGYPDAGVTFRK